MNHVFVVCGRNIALGVYPTQDMALDSIRQSCERTETVQKDDNHCIVMGFHSDTQTEFTIQTVIPSREAAPLF